MKIFKEIGRAHVAELLKKILLTVRREVLEHLAYSPNPNPSDYHSFRSMKSTLSNIYFSNS